MTSQPSPAPIQSKGCAVCSQCHRKFEPCCCNNPQDTPHCWWCGRSGKALYPSPAPIQRSRNG